MTEYGRIHTDGSRSGGQPAQGYGVVTAANYISPIGGAGVVTHGVVGVAAQSDALREKVARAIMLHHDIDPDVFIGMHGGYDHWLNAADAALAAINEIPRQPTQNDALREALVDLLHAVCGENGFAQAVRRDSGRIYPWPALDLAEAKAIAALEQSK